MKKLCKGGSGAFFPGVNLEIDFFLRALPNVSSIKRSFHPMQWEFKLFIAWVNFRNPLAYFSSQWSFPQPQVVSFYLWEISALLHFPTVSKGSLLCWECCPIQNCCFICFIQFSGCLNRGDQSFPWYSIMAACGNSYLFHLLFLWVKMWLLPHQCVLSEEWALGSVPTTSSDYDILNLGQVPHSLNKFSALPLAESGSIFFFSPIIHL